MSRLTDQILARLGFEAELAGPYVPADVAEKPEVLRKAKPEPSNTAAEERSFVSLATQTAAEVPPQATVPDAAMPSPDAKHLAPPASVYDAIADLIPSSSPMRDMKVLEEIEEYVAKTILIPLDESRLNPVFGVGNPNANLMVVGEAPGADEDDQGEPFVGRAGQLLNKILGSIDFARGDVYIANILKSRPPKNRNPTPLEVQAHLPILLKQISLIRPLLILCVGKTAGTSLLDLNTSLAKMRGRFHDFHGIPTVVTFHPAALLRNPNWKRPTWEDVQMLRARYDELMGTAEQ